MWYRWTFHADWIVSVSNKKVGGLGYFVNNKLCIARHTAVNPDWWCERKAAESLLKSNDILFLQTVHLICAEIFKSYGQSRSPPITSGQATVMSTRQYSNLATSSDKITEQGLTYGCLLYGNVKEGWNFIALAPHLSFKLVIKQLSANTRSVRKQGR